MKMLSVYSEWSKMRAERLLGQLNVSMIARGLIGWRAKGKRRTVTREKSRKMPALRNEDAARASLPTL